MRPANGVLESDITRVLAALREDPSAESELVRLAYEELRQMASSRMRAERDDHTLQPTALVNEALMRLLGGRCGEWENRAHFFGAAAEAMRRVLVDHARRRQAAKRRRPDAPPAMEAMTEADQTRDGEVVAIHEALERFAELDPARADLVKLRYFAGLTLEEIAGLWEVSLSTVKRDWRFARAWLYDQLRPPGSESRS